MSGMVSWLAYGLALAAVGVMGFAIQRGATCTVAAVEEVVRRRGARRLAALLEASVWVGGGLVLLRLLDALPAAPAAYAVSGSTIAGAVLLGLGAWVNGACVFGAIARFGSGEWAYAMTPVGYLVGCASAGVWPGPAGAPPLAEPSPVLAGAAWLAGPFLALVAWRLARASGQREWTPRAATIVIGITFLASWLLAGGAWPYTELLADLARGMADGVGTRVGLFLALWGGALVGGWQAGRWQSVAPAGAALARCFAGGVLMAWGTLLIPGANDGLILVGMPLLRPYAWVAFATMCLTIAAAMAARRLTLPALNA